MIRIRDDDVILSSTEYVNKPGGAHGRFVGIHKLIIQNTDKFIHVPTVLVTEIQGYPQTIEYIKYEAGEGRMEPQIHGLQHIDYKPLSLSEVKDHMNECFDFFDKEWGITPTRWYTPWGANAPHLYEAAAEVNLELIDCSNLLKPSKVRNDMIADLEAAREKYKDCEIFMHWWKGGAGTIDRIVRKL